MQTYHPVFSIGEAIQYIAEKRVVVDVHVVNDESFICGS